MKAKLLKKLRKKAHDAYRIAPGIDNGYEVQVYTNMWDRCKWFPTLKDAMPYIEEARKERFIHLAYALLYERRVKRLSKY